MKYCTNCGTQLPDEAVFCGACGCKCEPLVIETKEKVLNIEISDNPPVEWNQKHSGVQKGLFCTPRGEKYRFGVQKGLFCTPNQ